MPRPLKRGSLVYLPEGEHEIVAKYGGKASRVRVTVTADCVPLLQRDLTAMQAAALAGSAPRPCGLFDHRAGPASFIPLGFCWQQGRGVVLNVEWTEAGREAIEGGNYLYHSPYCLIEPGGTRPIGLDKTGVEVGSLVNDPAFRSIEAIAASRVSLADLPPTLSLEESGSPAHNADMDKLRKLLGLPDDADEATVLATVEELVSGKSKTEESLAAAQEETQKARQSAEEEKQKAEESGKELAAARAQLDTLREEGVKQFLAAHEKAGRIAPQDEAARKAWGDFYRSNALAASNAIMSIPAANDKGGTPLAGGRTPGPKSDNRSLGQLLSDTYNI